MVHLINSDVFLAFSTYATIVILKMIGMSILTVYYRITRKVQLLLFVFNINSYAKMHLLLLKDE